MRSVRSACARSSTRYWSPPATPSTTRSWPRSCPAGPSPSSPCSTSSTPSTAASGPTYTRSAWPRTRCPGCPPASSSRYPDRVIFRSAVRDDLPSILALMVDDDLGRTRDSTTVDDVYTQAFAHILADPRTFYLVGEEDGEVVGC